MIASDHSFLSYGYLNRSIIASDRFCNNPTWEDGCHRTPD